MRLLLTFVLALAIATPAQAYLIVHPKDHSRSARHAAQRQNLAHARFVCRYGGGRNKHWSCKAIVWLKREYAKTAPLPPRPTVDVAAWQQTVNCENGGNWNDSPGYFMYGLQFDPGSWATAARHTGHYGSAPVDQVVNAIWLRDHSGGDPWPNCPNP